MLTRRTPAPILTFAAESIALNVMEQLAIFVGWIDTKDTILNLNTGMTTEAIDGGKVVVTLPGNGDAELEFDGPDAAAILERAEMFAAIGDLATRIIKTNAEQAASGDAR